MLLETSSLNEIDSYSTDGFQFFKKEFKLLNYPLALLDTHLENKNLQYEFAYLVFKTKDEVISEKTYTFYHHIQDNYFTFPTKEEFKEAIILVLCYYYHVMEGRDWKEIKRILGMPDVNFVKYGIKLNKLKDFIADLIKRRFR